MFPAAARWPARHSSADEAVPRIPCTTRCPGSTRHRANSNCRRWTPARSMPSCQGCPTGMPLAPRDASAGYAGSRPLPGETITIGAGVPGLAAGTYTLLPAYYALLPGAFRVEVGANAQPFAPVGLRGGSWTVTATRGLAGTGTGDGWPRQALITPGDVLRRHAQYNEMDYQAYVLADATRKAAACVVASGCLCARTAIPLGRGQRRRDGVPIRRRDARQPRRAGLWRPGNRACGPAAGNREGRRHARIPGRLGPSGRYQRLGRRSHIHRRLDRSILDQPGPVEIRRARRRYLPAQRCCELPKSC